ncbi:MAG: hypothetical protein K8R02_00950 [Anaerohalosphaeraceae bacterium]|nr:hypothetical protein [Anaerohalosphaeraceae bacterium]
MLSLLEYLETLATKVDDPFGTQIRNHFADNKGSAELAMLASPSADELAQLKTAAAIMTKEELENANSLTDEQINKIASDAKIDAGIFAIFINGYALARKKRI